MKKALINTIMKTLYKRRQDGKVQVTTVELDTVVGRYRTTSWQSGALETSLVISAWTNPVAKNVGRSNETTAHQQAEKEVKSKITKMLDSGYVEDILNVDNPRITKVAMLAKPFDEERVSKEIEKTGGVDVQPKLDGVRCIATRQGLFTRAGKRIMGMDHIEEELINIFANNPEVMLDGELYNHDLRDDFDEIISCVRKETNIDLEQAKQIQYHIYDMVDEESSWRLRWVQLYGIYIRGQSVDDQKLSLPHKYLRLVSVQCIEERMERLFAQHEEFLEQGYEGTIIRYNAPYQKNKRNWNLQKLKEFQEDEFKIIRVEEGRGKNEGLASTIIVDVDGVEVDPTMMGSVEFRKQVWEQREDYVGGTATVKYFNKTKKGSLRHCNCKMVFKKERDL